MHGRRLGSIMHRLAIPDSLQIWDIFEDGSLFTGQDPELRTYRSRAHLAEMISLLGPPPPGLLAQGNLSRKFFSEEGASTIVLLFG